MRNVVLIQVRVNSKKHLRCSLGFPSLCHLAEANDIQPKALVVFRNCFCDGAKICNRTTISSNS